MKTIDTIVKLQVKAEEANPSPPIGPALGAKGINIMKFCKEFNTKTNKIDNLEKGMIVPVIITIYKDKSFSFIIKSPLTSMLIKKVMNITKGSSNPNKNKIGQITQKHIDQVIKLKQNDLIVNSKESASKTILGTAKSMGLTINEE